MGVQFGEKSSRGHHDAGAILTLAHIAGLGEIALHSIEHHFQLVAT
jgi:hypothetical protein